MSKKKQQQKEKTKLSVLLFQRNIKLSKLKTESKRSYKQLWDMKEGNRDNFSDATWDSVKNAINALGIKVGYFAVKLDDIKGFVDNGKEKK